MLLDFRVKEIILIFRMFNSIQFLPRHWCTESISACRALQAHFLCRDKLSDHRQIIIIDGIACIDFNFYKRNYDKIA
jgi:hypothetical protein